jgi:ABC-type polysaccharide/polyol phosphate transport system ATPase subunit
MPRIVIENASVRYPVFDASSRSLKVSLLSRVGLGRGAGPAHVRALTDISLTVADGERLGLVGRNGAGKSTLLRLIGGLIGPSSGRAAAYGRVIPVIERGIGIHPELTGRQNIELPLRLLGATREEVLAAREEIPDFTGLGEFIDLPYRTYSEGMKARLVFALCTSIPADVLVLDEWLGAGDIDFTERAQRRLTDFLTRSRTLVLASHSLDLIERVATRVVWIDGGHLKMDGDPARVCNAYREHMSAPAHHIAAAE